MAKKKANRSRKNLMRFFVTDEEQAQIMENKAKSKIKYTSSYLRKMALDGIIVNTDLTVIKDNTVALNRIGTNINQIAKRMNESANINKNDVIDVKKMISEIAELQREVLKSFGEII